MPMLSAVSSRLLCTVTTCMRKSVLECGCRCVCACEGVFSVSAGSACLFLRVCACMQLCVSLFEAFLSKGRGGSGSCPVQPTLYRVLLLHTHRSDTGALSTAARRTIKGE